MSRRKQGAGRVTPDHSAWKADRSAVDMLLRALGYPGIAVVEPKPQPLFTWTEEPCTN